jgi:hypothetical protein
MREKRRKKEKNFITIQSDLLRENAPHFQKENDSPLSTPLRKYDFGNLMGLHAPPKRYGSHHVLTRALHASIFFLIISNNLKLSNKP